MIDHADAVDSHAGTRLLSMNRWTKIGLGCLVATFCAVMVTAFLPVSDMAKDIIYGVARVVNVAVLAWWAVRWAMQWHRTGRDTVSGMELNVGLQWLMRTFIGVFFAFIVTVGVFGGSMHEWSSTLRLGLLVVPLVAGAGLVGLVVVESVAERRQERVDSEHMSELMAQLMAQNSEGPQA